VSPSCALRSAQQGPGWSTSTHANCGDLLFCVASLLRSKHVDWDKFAKEVQKEEKEEQLEGDQVGQGRGAPCPNTPHRHSCHGQPAGPAQRRPATPAPGPAASALLASQRSRLMPACPVPHPAWPPRPCRP
jgi:hypothetical protein